MLTSLLKAFLAIEKLQAKLDKCQNAQQEAIAVVGMACRFPGGSDSPEQYWQMMLGQVDAVITVPEQRWHHADYYDPSGITPNTTYVNEAAFIEQVDGFDADFFGIPPREANSLDPQQRLLLELAYEALQHAGIASVRLKNSKTGVFIGIGQQDYLQLLREYADTEGEEHYTGTGNGFCFASGRLSYLLGLQGPSFSIDTACSSSLVAVHQACLSLRAQECDLALTGGVQLILSPSAFLLMSGSKALAKDGRCKSFSALADGYGRGEGAGLIALKRLSDAQRDGDRVLAVIRGSAVGHDGRSSGLTVPNGLAQQALLKQVLKVSHTQAEQVGYVETHGTGTSLGDPIEYKALADVLCQSSSHPLLLGAVKSNIGHLEAAAGIAGLIKLIQTINKGKIPANLHFERPNPVISWQDNPIKVVTRLSDWPKDKTKVGIVSSFGLSGTNGQVLVAEPPKVEHANKTHQLGLSYVFKLSAKTKRALVDWLRQHQQVLHDLRPNELADFCFSANISRDDFNWRVATVVKNSDQLYGFIQSVLAQDSVQEVSKKPLDVVFMFAGQGSVKAGAGLDLFNTQPVFKVSMQACDEALKTHGHMGAVELLYGEQAESLLQQTEHEQVALFALQYALAKMYLSWGVKPAMVLGHSVGEYVAACIADVFDINTALQILSVRGRLMQAMPENGQMLAVYANQREVESLLKGLAQPLSIAAINADDQIVVSGCAQAVQGFIVAAQSQGLTTKKLPVKRGFHSSQIDSILPELKQNLAKISFNKPQIRFISTLTGQQETTRLSTVDYWLKQARQPVLFKSAIDTARQLGGQCFIELSARPILSLLIDDRAVTAICCLGAKEDDWFYSQKTLAALYKIGGQIDWLAVYQGRRQQLMDLPNYPWQRKRYWFKAAVNKPKPPPHNTALHPMIEQCLRSPLITDILYQGSISCRQLPFLLDHKVFDHVVVAGACHLSAIAAAGHDLFKFSPFVIQQVEFNEALTLAEQDERVFQLCLSPLGKGSYVLKSITFSTDNTADYIDHMQAVLAERKANSADKLNLADIKQQCSSSMDLDGFYQLLVNQQVLLGQSFRWFKSIAKGENQAFSSMRQPVFAEQSFDIPPGLIDACFQLMGAAVPQQYTDTFIPVAIETIHFTGDDLPAEINAYAHLDDDSIGAQGFITGQVSLCNAQGEVFAQLSGVTLRKADQKLLQQALLKQSHRYVLEWENVALLSHYNKQGDCEPCLLVGDDLARQLAQGIAQAKCVSIDEFAQLASFSEQRVLFCIDGSQDENNLIERAQHNTEQLLLCLQKTINHTNAQLTIISQSVRACKSSDSVDLSVELISGLLRSFNNEHPETPCQWLDLDTSLLPLRLTTRLLNSLTTESEIAVREAQVFAPRLKAVNQIERVKKIDWQGHYLLTGGSGALALQTAQWLVNKGVRKLILMSRNGVLVSNQNQLEDFKKQGVEVVEIKGDVSNAEFVQSTLAQFASDLKGIFHIAGVLQDSLIVNLQNDQLRQVLQPKAAGLWNLHQYSQALNLDCFVAYSSVAAVLGAPGQGNYAVANSFMDALMHQRHKQGLVGLSINWGPWVGQGMASQQQDSNLAESGIAKLSAEQAFSFLDHVVLSNHSQLGLFDINWQQFNFNLSSLTQIFRRQSKLEQPQSSVTLTQQLADLPVLQRQRFLADYLAMQVRNVLGLSSTDSLAFDAGFYELGMDSLMTLELKNRLQKAVGQNLPSTLAFKYHSVDELLEFFIADVFTELFAADTIEDNSESSPQDLDEGVDIAQLLEQELLQMGQEPE